MDLVKSSWKPSAVRDDGWVTLPSRRHLVFLKSKDIIRFNILNVLLSKCYLILQNSVKIFGHSSSRIASGNWDPVQKVVFTNMAPSSAESTESHKHGVCSVWVCHFWLHMPMLICSTEAERWGRAPVCPAGTSWPSERPPVGSVLGADLAASPPPMSV